MPSSVPSSPTVMVWSMFCLIPILLEISKKLIFCDAGGCLLDKPASVAVFSAFSLDAKLFELFPGCCSILNPET